MRRVIISSFNIKKLTLSPFLIQTYENLYYVTLCRSCGAAIISFSSDDQALSSITKMHLEECIFQLIYEILIELSFLVRHFLIVVIDPLCSFVQMFGFTEGLITSQNSFQLKGILMWRKFYRHVSNSECCIFSQSHQQHSSKKHFTFLQYKLITYNATGGL